MKLDHQQRNLYNIGVSYKKADAHTRGRYSLSKENQIKLLKEFTDSLTQAKNYPGTESFINASEKIKE